jgi:hypothetical protein
MFFFEKKNQKNFCPRRSKETDKSLFASFSSEKEDPSFHPTLVIAHFTCCGPS